MTISVILTIMIILRKLRVMYTDTSVTKSEYVINSNEIMSTMKKNLGKYPFSANDLAMMSHMKITILSHNFLLKKRDVNTEKITSPDFAMKINLKWSLNASQ